MKGLLSKVPKRLFTAPASRVTGLVRLSATLALLTGAILVAGVALPGATPAAAATPDTISTIAGNGTAGNSGDSGPATSAEFEYPDDVTSDIDGIFIADSYNHVIRFEASATCSSSCPFGLATTAGDIYTLAGDGTAGFMGNGGPATSAELGNPEGVVTDAAGDLIIGDNYFTDFNTQIRLVARANCSSSCPFGLSSMTAGYIYGVAGNGNSGYSGAGGPATSAEIGLDYGVAFDSGGDLLIGDISDKVVWLVAKANCSSSCPFGLPSTVANDIYTVAGDGTAGYSGNGGPATSAELNGPYGVAIDTYGDLVIADSEQGGTGNHVVRLVAKSTCSSSCPFGLPSTVANDIYTVAGNNTAGNSGDGGPATSAELGNPYGVAIDSAGDILISDPQGVVRLVAKSTCSVSCPFGQATTLGDIYTIAGGGSAGSPGYGDGGAATSAELDDPLGLAIDPSGDLLITDSYHFKIRLVTAGPTTPSISTAPSVTSPITTGTSAHDTATLSGATSNAGGTISYDLYSNSSCTDLVQSLTPSPNTVTDASVPNSNPYVFNSPGTFYFQATYSGDTNNTGPVSSVCSSGAMVVNSQGVGAPPGAPQELTAMNEGNEIVLTWEGSTGANCYDIYRYTQGNAATLIATICPGSSSAARSASARSAADASSPSSGDPSYTDTSVSCGITYTYYVAATNNIGPSSPSNTASSTVPCGTGTTASQGYWLAGSDGGIFSFGNVSYHGSVPGEGIHINNVVGMAATKDSGGYWMVGSDGGIFTFGDAAYHGSVPGDGIHINNVVGIAPTSDGGGYYAVGTDGGVFTFGDAVYHGSVPGDGIHVNNIIGILPTPDGGGYWIVGSDGGVFTFGDATYHGSVPGDRIHINNVVGLAPTSDGAGYWMVGTDGGVFTFGDAVYRGSVPGDGIRVSNVRGILATPDSGGYWLFGTDGGIFTFGDATYEGSVPGDGIHVNNILAGAP